MTRVPRRLLAAALLMSLSGVSPGLAAWPTAGGEDGETVRVTTLADSGPGSLRAALAGKTPRRIVFEVGGEIRLKNRLMIMHPEVTIAGETAPSPGITLFGDKLQIRADDVILRHIRVRIGEGEGSGRGSRDGISIDPGRKGEPVKNVLIENCSVSWALDENISVQGEGISNVLIRRSIVAEALRKSVHPKGEHSMGMLIGEKAHNVVVAENLFAHNVHRNPVVHGGASAVVVNNLIYDPGITGFHIYRKKDAGPTLASVVGNLVVAGPSTRDGLWSFDHGMNEGSKIYYDDNAAIGTKAFSLSEDIGKSGEPVPFAETPPIWFDWLAPLPAAEVEETVLAEAGARPWDRDATDKRIVEEVRKRSGAIRDMPADERLRMPRPLPDDMSGEK